MVAEWLIAIAVLTGTIGAGAELSAEAAPAKPAVLRAASISDQDYPQAALRAREEGTVVTRFLVTVDGGVEQCEILSSSNSAALDERSCAIVTGRFRYKPARDASGAKVSQHVEQVFAWRISAPCPREPAAICIRRD